MVQNSVDMSVRVEPYKVSVKLFEQLLTEVVEIMYGAFGLTEKVNSTVIGSGEVSSPKLNSFAERKMKESL